MPEDHPSELQETDFPPVESDLERSTEKKCAQPIPSSPNSSHCSYEDIFGKGIDELKRKGSLREWRLFVLSRELAKYEREKVQLNFSDSPECKFNARNSSNFVQ